MLSTSWKFEDFVEKLIVYERRGVRICSANDKKILRNIPMDLGSINPTVCRPGPEPMLSATYNYSIVAYIPIVPKNTFDASPWNFILREEWTENRWLQALWIGEGSVVAAGLLDGEPINDKEMLSDVDSHRWWEAYLWKTLECNR
jgi:hypothetical protein